MKTGTWEADCGLLALGRLGVGFVFSGSPLVGWTLSLPQAGAPFPLSARLRGLTKRGACPPAASGRDSPLPGKTRCPLSGGAGCGVQEWQLLPRFSHRKLRLATPLLPRAGGAISLP